MVRIRRALVSDATFIAEVYRPFVEDGWTSFETDAPSADEIADRISTAGDAYPWLIAEGDEPLGYAYASPHRTRPAYVTSVDTAIYCAPQAKGQGVGKALYTQLCKTLIWQGYVMAFAGIALPNAASIALHQSVGFNLIGTYPSVGHKAGEWRDTQWWSKSLAKPVTPPKSIRPLSEITDDLFH